MSLIDTRRTDNSQQAQLGMFSNIPLWLANLNWGDISSKAAGNLINGLSQSVLGNSAMGLTVGNLGNTVGSSIVLGMLTNLNVAQNLRNINFSQDGYGLAGGLIGLTIGGDAGNAIGTTISNIPSMTNGIKAFKDVKNGMKAGESLTKAGKITQANNLGSVVGTAANAIGSFIPGRNESSGTHGNITRGMDSAYGAIQSAANYIPGIGNLVSGGMAVADLLGKTWGALGGGTDGMTSADAILGSKFLGWTPISALNGWTGKHSHSYERNEDDWNLVGGALNGSNELSQWAVDHSHKKYGGFSSGARHHDNNKIDEANWLKVRIGDMAYEDKIRDLIYNSMPSYYSNNTYNQLNGGILFSKLGSKLDRAKKTLSKLKEGGKIEEDTWSPKEWNSDTAVPKYAEGGDIWNPLTWFDSPKKDDFDIYLESLPKPQQDSANFRVKRYWELNGKPKDFDEAKAIGMFDELPDGWHAHTVAYDEDNDLYEFMKKPNHKSIWMEEAFYNGLRPKLKEGHPDNQLRENYDLVPLEGKDLEESNDLRSHFDLDKSGEFWRYVRKPETEKFKEGGKMNVIPEGALHARLHHMDLKGITKKGIPVITEENGKVVLQAEIEVNEIIFNLDVTKKIEELMKDGSDKAAIEAGKLLASEIIENTDDRTGLIQEVQ